MARSGPGSVIGMILFGGIFLMVGIGVILFLAGKSTLICTRVSNDTGTCILKHEKLLSADVKQMTYQTYLALM